MFNTSRVDLVFLYEWRLFSMQVILSRYASFSTCTFNAGNGRVVRTCTSVLRLLACYTLQFDASKKERSTQIFFVGRLFARGKKKKVKKPIVLRSPYQIQHCLECIFKLFLKTVFNLFCEMGFK